MAVRLIDANELWDSIRKDTAPFNVAMVSRHIHSSPTIDPETLPIVRELRANIAIQEKIIENHHNPFDTDQIVKLSLENSNLKQQLAEVTAERNFAVQTIFKWTGCPECRNWDSKDDWCKKYDREASCIDGCDYPEWRGIQEE